VDLGAVFDLGDLRPFANLHAGGSLSMANGISTLASPNVHTIALQVPKTMLTADGSNIFLTGIPSGIVPGFQRNTGTTQTDLLRLNMAIPPSSTPNPAGLVAGDAAGFPNGRRLEDDIVTIELRALVDLRPGGQVLHPDAAASIRLDLQGFLTHHARPRWESRTLGS
jgi:hypothetical protein